MKLFIFTSQENLGEKINRFYILLPIKLMELTGMTNRINF